MKQNTLGTKYARTYQEARRQSQMIGLRLLRNNVEIFRIFDSQKSLRAKYAQLLQERSDWQATTAKCNVGFEIMKQNTLGTKYARTYQEARHQSQMTALRLLRNNVGMSRIRDSQKSLRAKYTKGTKFLRNEEMRELISFNSKVIFFKSQISKKK